MSENPLSWIWVGWYGNNPDKQRLVIARSALPVTTALERYWAKAFASHGDTFPCAGCGKFAFPKPQRCFWCNKEGR